MLPGMLPYMDNTFCRMISSIFSSRRHPSGFAPLLKARSLDRRLHVRGYVVEGEEKGKWRWRKTAQKLRM